MAIIDRLWGALTTVAKIQDEVTRQADTLTAQQTRVEHLTERVIRVEAQLELLTGTALLRRLKDA